MGSNSLLHQIMPVDAPFVVQMSADTYSVLVTVQDGMRTVLSKIFALPEDTSMAEFFQKGLQC